MADTLKMYAVVEFENGLSVIPDIWLTKDRKEAFWPTYTNTARYDKPVKRMEDIGIYIVKMYHYKNIWNIL